MKKRKKHTAWYELENQWNARKKSWYHNEADDLGKERFTVHRSPVNFFCCLPPFGLHAVEAEDVEGGGHEENYYAARVTKVRSISPKDIGKISVRESLHCRTARTRGENAVVSSGDAGAAGYKAFAVSLEAGNASVFGEHCAAITLGEHGGAAANGNFSHAVALSHGSNAAASGPLGHAATFVDGWAISGDGNAVALGSGSAISYGSQSSAVACGDRDAFAVGKYGKAVTCQDSGKALAYGTRGEAIALGEDAQASCGGKGLAIATGRNGMAKGAVGTWLVLAERDRYERIVAIIPVYVDGENIKPDTWYMVRKGKVVAVDERS